MRQAAASCSDQLAGTLRIGAIPTSLAIVPLITEPYQATFPQVSIQLFSRCAEDLIRQIDGFELNLGITYLDDPRLKGFQVSPLYRERHVLLARDAGAFAPTGRLSWSDAAELPLCLLTPNMENRRLIDAAFREADATPRVMLETDSVFALYTHVRCAGLYSIVPHSLLCLFEMHQEVTAIPLRPELERSIGLIARSREAMLPIQQSAWNLAARFNLQARLDALIDVMNHSIETND